MGEVMKEAAFSLAEAKFATGDFNQVVLQNVTKAQIKIRTKKDNVAGVTLPVFESYTVSKWKKFEDFVLFIKNISFVIIGRSRHIRIGRFSSWWTAANQTEEKLSGSREVAGRIGFVANVIRHAGRSHQDHQSQSKRYRAR